MGHQHRHLQGITAAEGRPWTCGGSGRGPAMWCCQSQPSRLAGGTALQGKSAWHVAVFSTAAAQNRHSADRLAALVGVYGDGEGDQHIEHVAAEPLGAVPRLQREPGRVGSGLGLGDLYNREGAAAPPEQMLKRMRRPTLRLAWEPMGIGMAQSRLEACKVQWQSINATRLACSPQLCTRALVYQVHFGQTPTASSPPSCTLPQLWPPWCVPVRVLERVDLRLEGILQGEHGHNALACLHSNTCHTRHGVCTSAPSTQGMLQQR